MKELVNALVPDIIKFTSVGSTLGLTLGITLSFFLEKTFLLFLCGFFLILTIVGIWQLKDEFIDFFKTL